MLAMRVFTRAAGIVVAKHERMRAAIFTEPTRANIRWAAIEALLVHLGATIREGSGSRIAVRLNGVQTVFHRPHPGNQASKVVVESVGKFLEAAGVTP